MALHRQRACGEKPPESRQFQPRTGWSVSLSAHWDT